MTQRIRVKRVNGVVVATYFVDANKLVPHTRQESRETQTAKHCQHRGSELRTMRCEICGADKNKMLPVYSCDIHGECTHRKVRHVQTERQCIGCPDGPWAPPE